MEVVICKTTNSQPKLPLISRITRIWTKSTLCGCFLKVDIFLFQIVCIKISFRAIYLLRIRESNLNFSIAEEEDGALVRSLAESVRPKVVAIAAQAKQALFSAQAEDRRHRMDTLQSKIDEVMLLHYPVCLLC